MNKIIYVLAVMLTGAGLLAGCGRPGGSGTSPGETETGRTPPAGATSGSQVLPVPDLTEVAKDPHYLQAVRDATTLLGAQPQPLQNEEGPIPGGYMFAVPHDKAERLLRQAHTDFLAKGCYLFRYDQSFGFGGQPDQIGLLPTTNQFDVMALVEINGANYDLDTASIVDWMKQLEQEQPYVLTGIGVDYMEGYFTNPIKEPYALARRMYSFCPDIVDQGVGTVDKLADELRKGHFYLWWD